MSTAFWWYGGAAETQLLAQLTTDGQLDKTLDGVSLVSTGTALIAGVVSQTLDSLTLSSTAFSTTFGSLSVELEGLTLVSFASESLLFVVEEEVERVPEPIVHRLNSYIGTSIIFDSMYGDDPFIYNKENPTLISLDGDLTFNKENPELINRGDIVLGNWKNLFRVK